MNGSELQSGTRVSFRLAEVVCPDIERVVREMTTSLEVTGSVVLLSDYGDQKDHFAIVNVEGISSPLIVPVDRIKVMPEPQAAPDTAVQR